MGILLLMGLMICVVGAGVTGISTTPTPPHSSMLKKLMTFSSNGYAFMDNVLPELREQSTQESIRVAMTLAQLEFVISCEDHLVLTYNTNCSKVQYSKCKRNKWTVVKDIVQKRIDEIKANGSEVDHYSDYLLFERGLRSVLCCITETNKLLNRNADDGGLRLPYIQYLNLHRSHKAVMELATKTRLGEVASFLLQEDRVRLYQTAIFQKIGNENSSIEFGAHLNRPTGWHNDLNMIPLDVSTGGYLTFWCPLSDIASSRNDSLLYFAKSSHRDISANYWYEHIMGVIGGKHNNTISVHDAVVNRYKVAVYDQISVGSCTVHDGWLYHSANSQISGTRDRVAIGFSFVSARATVLPELNVEHQNLMRRDLDAEDSWSYKDWLKDLEPFGIIDHPLLPLVYDKTKVFETARNSISIQEAVGTDIEVPHVDTKAKKKVVSVQAIKKNATKYVRDRIKESPSIRKTKIFKIRAIKKNETKTQRKRDNHETPNWEDKKAKELRRNKLSSDPSEIEGNLEKRNLGNIDSSPNVRSKILKLKRRKKNIS